MQTVIHYYRNTWFTFVFQYGISKKTRIFFRKN